MNAGRGSTSTFVTSGLVVSKMVVLTSRRALSTSHNFFSPKTATKTRLFVTNF